MASFKSRVPELLGKHQKALLSEWVKEQRENVRQKNNLDPAELEHESDEFLRLLEDGLKAATSADIHQPAFDALREHLSHISRSRSQRGFSPSETATFVFSLKLPLLRLLRTELGKSETILEETLFVTELLDCLGLFTTEVYQKRREEIIARQQQELLELSTPVVKLWTGILALPLIGTLDSARTQIVMESLLQKIVETGSDVAIIDITGVPTVDTLVAQHLLKTVTAARLMGADCIISGIRPQIAQTIVHLGVELGDVCTKSNLADAFRLALQRRGLVVQRASAVSGHSNKQANS
jgi:rsbT co-antagonist protein RsbR